jgi:ABC-type nitrate/sulfonate/bicarbonate transport system substrate-binding protein
MDHPPIELHIMSRTRVRISTGKEPLRLGFVPLSDCAPLVYGWEAGLFARHGLEVELRRETRWSDIRDKIISGDLDAAQAPATLPFLTNLGLESDPFACVSAMVLSLEGCGIVVSKQLWGEGVEDASSLRELIYRNWRKRTFTFAVSSLYSPEHLIFRHWLKLAAIIPDVEIRLIVIPPDQLFPTLKLGYIDGFCAGEPWISVTVAAGIAKCIVGSGELIPRHPAKVLIVRQSYAAGRFEEHERLLAALLEACAFCNNPGNQTFLGEMLAPANYVNAPAEFIRGGLPATGSPISTNGEPARTSIFSGTDANEPTDTKAEWVISNLYEVLGRGMGNLGIEGRSPVLKNIFRTDIYARAKAALGGDSKGGGIEWKPEHEALAG